MTRLCAFLLTLNIAACGFAAATRPSSRATTIPTTKPAPDLNHALILRNGRIIDGAGNPWFYGDVFIRGSRIAAIGKIEPQSLVPEIDARGMIVAPGFIDVHTHVDSEILDNPLAENFIRDGVTTVVTGNCGGSVGDVGDYFEGIRSKGSAINIATLIGHGRVLKDIKGGGAAKLTDEQMQKAKAMVDEAMREGAVGMSTGLIYRPGVFSSTEEIIELQKVAAKHGGIYATHMRGEGAEILQSIEEALRIGREANCRVEISHFKLPADVAKKLGGANTTLAKVLAARRMGQEVWVDQYPYTASSTGISTLLPDWIYDKGNDEAEKRLKDPAMVGKILADMKKTYETGSRPRASLAYAVIANYEHEPQFAGRNVYEMAQIFKFRELHPGHDVELLSSDPPKLPDVTMEDQYRAVIEICRNGGAKGVFHTMDEQEVEDILRCDLIAVASDAGIRTFGAGVPHPRGYGTNARVLGHYVREKKTITLEDAVRKMTSLPATAFRFSDRGLLRAGYLADIAVFDEKTVADRGTFEQPHQYPVGISFVIVNGHVVLRDGKMTGTLPGGPIFGPGATAGEKTAADAGSSGGGEALSGR
jgi:N-acyl-D-amino-acid deacylase